MEGEGGRPSGRASSLRWEILREALLRRRPSLPNPCDQTPTAFKRISRKTASGFNLIPSQLVEDPADVSNFRDARICYTLPVDGAPKLFLTQRVDNTSDLSDFEISNKHNVDNTGLVCQWPSEDVLAYFCLSHAETFRSKKVIELGSGYGLAGLVTAATTEALEVIISDGNPQVVDLFSNLNRASTRKYQRIKGQEVEPDQRNIDANSTMFGNTKVKTMILHWNQEETSNLLSNFDIIVASDCTFFKEFHEGLACTVKQLLRDAETSSEAMFFSPKRGNSLDKFLQKIEENGLRFHVSENYDAEVWKRHQSFMDGDDSWPNYEKDHCYPLLVRITL